MRTTAILFVTAMVIGCGAVRSNIENFELSQEDYALTVSSDVGSLTVGVTGVAVETEEVKAHAGFCFKVDSEMTEASESVGGVGAFLRRLLGC